MDINLSQADSESQQQGAPKKKPKQVDSANRRSNQMVIRQHLDTDLSELNLRNDYVDSMQKLPGKGSGGRTTHFQQQSHGQMPAGRSSHTKNIESDLAMEMGGHRRAGTTSVQDYNNVKRNMSQTPNSKGMMPTAYADSHQSSHTTELNHIGMPNVTSLKTPDQLITKGQLARIADNSSDEDPESEQQKDAHVAYQSRHEPSGAKDSSNYNSEQSQKKEKSMNTSEKRRQNFRAKPVQSSVGLLNQPGGLGNNPKATFQLDANQQELEEMFEEDKDKLIRIKAPWKLQLAKFMNHWSVTLVMTIVTLYALFGDDLKVAFFSKSADTTFNVITIGALVLFSVEITLNAICQDGYFNSFYFWLDIISTLSLVTDISWIWDLILGQQEDYSASNAEQAGQLARAGRGARIGTRAGRITRVIRLIRLIRIGRLWKQANSRLNKAQAQEDEFAMLLKQQRTINMMKQQKQMETSKKDIAKINKRASILQTRKKKDQPIVQSIDNSDSQHQSNSNLREYELSSDLSKSQIEIEQPRQEAQKFSKDMGSSIMLKSQDVQSMDMLHRSSDLSKEQNMMQMAANQTNNESKVGKILSESTQKAVITLVLSMLLSAAVLDLQLYILTPPGYSLGLKVLTQCYGDQVAFDTALSAYLDSYKDDAAPLLQVIVNDFVWDDGTDLKSLRPNEKNVSYYVSPETDEASIAVHDLRQFTRVAAILGIVTTLAICVVLATGSLLLSKITQDLVLSPIEDMIKNVKAITRDPIQAAQQAEEDAVKQEEQEKAIAAAQGKKVKGDTNKHLMETEVLQRTLNKIGGLLAIGFGEAGSKIIAQNMRKGDDVDPLLPGQKCIAIFGFCDIRKFTDATEILQEGVMLFVNEIGEIVHGVVDRYQGAANKNIGDAFLLVWKFDDDSIEEDQETGELVLVPSNKVSQLCDMSLISFLKIIGLTKRSRKMRKYANHPGLNKRMPNYEVKMGFGLHQGWAIEGALGSFYKIDASYLSPNVNMSSKLEEETKTYDSPVLISGSLYNHFTDSAKKECRQIDNILFKGQTQPTALYTCDVDSSHLELEPFKSALSKKQARTARVKARLGRNAFKESIMLGEIDVALLFQTDNDLIEMRSKFPEVFFDVFNEGFRNFLSGNWDRARKQLIQIEFIKKEPDTPSKVLLDYMAEYNFTAPEDWQGYRVQDD